MRLRITSIWKRLSISLLLCLMSLGLIGQMPVSVLVLQNNVPVPNYPVWVQIGTTPQAAAAGNTGFGGVFFDSIQAPVNGTRVTTWTYDCNGNPISVQTIISPNVSYIGDTLSLPCSSPAPDMQVTGFFTPMPGGNTFNFAGITLDSALPSTAVYSYSWDFGDGNTSTASPSVSHTYASNGTYLACFTATVTDSAANLELFTRATCMTVPVGSGSGSGNCMADFGFSINAFNLMAGFNDSSSVNLAPGDRVSYGWDFGDGNSDTVKNPIHTYSSPGTYTVCLWISISTFGSVTCSDTICRTITVGQQPVTCQAAFTSRPDSLDPFGIKFDASGSSVTGGNPVTYTIEYFWNFGDGGIDSIANPTHIYAGPGNYNVCLTIEVIDNQLGRVCTSVVCDSMIQIASPFCDADYIVDTANSFFGNVIVWNMSGPVGPGYTATWLWNFGDGNTSTLPFPTHSYATAGIYQVCVTIDVIDSLNNRCTDTYCDTLGVDSLGNLIYKSTAGFTINVMNPGSISLEEQLQTKFKLFPNPANDRVMLQWGDYDSGEIRWIISDLKGMSVLEGNASTSGMEGVEIDLSRLGSGMYILSTFSKNRPLTNHKLKVN